MDTNNIQNIEEMIKTLPKGRERDLWQKVLDEAKRFEAMSDREIEADLKKSDEEASIAEDQLKLLEMDEKEREKEIARRKAEAERKREAAEKEWEEAAAAATPILVEEDAERRRAEAEVIKKITTDKTDELLEDLKSFLAKDDLAGSGAVLKKMAATGKMGDVLNYFGYSSDMEGMHQFFNVELLKGKTVEGEKAYDNLLLQQKVYALERDISCLAEGMNNWCLAFAMGRKQRLWSQLNKEDHLLVVAEAVRGFKPGVAARIFWPSSYGFFESSGRFILGSEGRLIFMLFSEDFIKQLEAGEFNPETAKVFSGDQEQLKTLNLSQPFFVALKKYSENLKTGFLAAEKVFEENKK